MKHPSIPPLNPADLLKRFGLRADKRLGQNFLEDPLALEQIIRASDIDPADTVLEIGAGLGSLTRYLALFANQVVAVELDRKLLPALRAVLAPCTNVRIVHGDILKLSPAELIDRPDYVVVANIPYYITSAILRHLLDLPAQAENLPRPRRIVLTTQKEVAERICAAPGDLSLLALSVQVYGQPRVAALIPAGAFFPVPQVDSAVLVIEVYPAPLLPGPQLKIFFQLVRAGFSQKRKTLRNSLSAGLHIRPEQAASLLTKVEIDPGRRAETLSISEWQRLVFERLRQKNGPAGSVT